MRFNVKEAGHELNFAFQHLRVALGSPCHANPSAGFAVGVAKYEPRGGDASAIDCSSRDGAIVEMTVEIRDTRQLDKVRGSIRRIPGVRDIERV